MTDADPARERILFVGAGNQGSHARALARAFSRAGQTVVEVDPRHYFPAWRTAWLRALGRLLQRAWIREFNAHTLREAAALEPTLVVVYKGEAVEPDTVSRLRAKCPCVNVFPDVSVFTHGKLLPAALPRYTHIFTTKSFGPQDLKNALGIDGVSYLPHGFDPELHLLPEQTETVPGLSAAVSFIGTWSPKKESFLCPVAADFPLRIWGSQWEKAKSRDVLRCAQGREVMGMLYPLAARSSAISIALLSEARRGSSSGDLTTARTFDLPAAGAFMLHERTPELLGFFRENDEVACFASPEELAAKVRYFLTHPDERELIRVAGRQRCLADHSIDARAAAILGWKQEYDQARRVY